MHKYVAPEHNLKAFTCPYCSAFAQMRWDRLTSLLSDPGLSIAKCSSCEEISCWYQFYVQTMPKMVVPKPSNAPLPHADMPPEVKADYDEARAILNESPRAAAALLRLSMQRLCIVLGEPGKNINDDIGSLVKKGLPAGIQKALDVVRVVGNNAVHPGKLSDDDLAEVAIPLFKLINVIVEDRICRPKELEDLYQGLPQGARDAVDKRDK